MLDPTTATLIVNPQASAGRVRKGWRTIHGTVREHLGDVRIVETTHAGHATELARDLVLDGSKTLLTLGGDGTNNEVVNGIMSAGVPPGTVQLGILPYGTGGDFRRNLVDSHNYSTAAASLMSAESHPVDIGKIEFIGNDGTPTVRWFLNVASFGIGGVIDRIVNNSPKWFGGKASFYMGTLRGLAQYRAATCRLRIDGVDVGEYTVSNVFVGNARYAGGGMLLARDALVDDGLLDISVIPDFPLLKSIRSLPKLYDGSYQDLDDVPTWRAHTVEAELVGENDAWLDVDGEAPGKIPAKFTIEKSAIRIFNLCSDVRVRS